MKNIKISDLWLGWIIALIFELVWIINSSENVVMISVSVLATTLVVGSTGLIVYQSKK